jgi:hypothetical protein
MTWKDKLEIGLKNDAPFRADNLPEFQRSPGRPAIRPDDPSRSPVEVSAVRAAEAAAKRGVSGARKARSKAATKRRPGSKA